MGGRSYGQSLKWKYLTEQTALYAHSKGNQLFLNKIPTPPHTPSVHKSTSTKPITKEPRNSLILCSIKNSIKIIKKIQIELRFFVFVMVRKSKENGSDSVAPFLTKCYEMVDDEVTDSIISWTQPESCNSFVIWDMTEFSVKLLPLYFKHNNFSSFMRQLNIYVSFFFSSALLGFY